MGSDRSLSFSAGRESAIARVAHPERSRYFSRDPLPRRCPIFRRTLICLVALGALLPLAGCAAQAPEPYKLGTFERQGRTFVGIVLRDSLAIDFPAANDAVATTGGMTEAPTRTTASSTSS